MKFIKRNLKWIITIILVIIITTGISVYATTTYFANQVPYTTNKNAEISTVEDALNDLYTISSTYKNLNQTTTASARDILSGKTAYDNLGNLITGELADVSVFSDFQITASSSKVHYNLGFNPKFVFMILGSNYYLYGVNGDTNAYWISQNGNDSGTDTNCFSIGNNGFDLQHGANESVTLYAIK